MVFAPPPSQSHLASLVRRAAALARLLLGAVGSLAAPLLRPVRALLRRLAALAAAERAEPAGRLVLTGCATPFFAPLPWAQLPPPLRASPEAARLWSEAAGRLRCFRAFLKRAARFCPEGEEQLRLQAVAAFYLDFCAALLAAAAAQDAAAAAVPRLRAAFAARLPTPPQPPALPPSELGEEACERVWRSLAAAEEEQATPASAAALEELLVVDVWSALSYRRERATLVAASLGWLLVDCCRTLTGPQHPRRCAPELLRLLQAGVACFEQQAAPNWLSPLTALSLGLPQLPRPRR
jgi:hypothetical protein